MVIAQEKKKYLQRDAFLKIFQDLSKKNTTLPSCLYVACSRKPLSHIHTSSHNILFFVVSEVIAPWGQMGEVWWAIPVYLMSSMFNFSIELYNSFGDLPSATPQKA